MSLAARVPQPVRRAVSRTVDPWAARRATTLLRRQGGRPAASADDRLGRALEELRGRALAQAGADVARGLLPVDEPALNRLVAGQLARLQPNAVPASLVTPISHAFTSLWQPDAEPVRPPPPPVEQAISDQFHRLWYHTSDRTWKNTTYRGNGTYKCPTDMWVYAELVHRLRPALVIETGTHRGGSALFFADCLELTGQGEVVSIDINAELARPQHPRITYLSGSSTAPELVEELTGRLPAQGHVLVVLDSDHRRDHVAAELAAYAPMVTVGSYLIVEDTNVNGHPAWPSWGPGPYEAAEAFLAGTDAFVVDPACEQYYLTMNPRGFLRRIH